MLKITFPNITLLDIEIEKGTTFTKEFQVIDEFGLPYSLVNKTISCEIRQYPLAGTGTTVTVAIALDSTSGIFSITVPKNTSFSYTRGFYDIKLKNTVTNTITSLVKGRVRILPTITSLT